MDANDYRDAIARLGLSQVKAGTVLGADARTSRRWAKDGPPNSVSVALAALLLLQDGGVKEPWLHPTIVDAKKPPSV